VANFYANKKADTVVKAVFDYKLKKDDSFRAEIETKMKNEKDGEKVLDETKYPKDKDGKYTQEAMIKYLYEQKTGKGHEFAAKSKDEPQEKNTPTTEKGH
jgi:hypothetical protein